MKKILMLLLVFSLLICACACKGEGTVTDVSAKPSADGKTETDPEKIPEAVKMVGVWKRVSVELDGAKKDAGDCTIAITGTSETDMRINYTDKATPDLNYSAKSITVADQSAFPLFGNGVWVAAVEHIGPDDTTYCLALFDNNTLKLQSYAIIDNKPVMGYEVFERV